MRPLLPKYTNWFLVAALIFLGNLLFAISIVQARPLAQTGSPAPSQAPIPTATPGGVSYQDLVAVHQQVLNSIQSTVTMVLNIIAVSGFASAGGVFFVAILIQRSLKTIDDKVIETKGKAEQFEGQIKSYSDKINSIQLSFGETHATAEKLAVELGSTDQRIRDLEITCNQSVENLRKKCDELDHELNEKKQLIDSLNEEIQKLDERLDRRDKATAQTLETSQTMYDIERNSAELSNPDELKRNTALQTLVEYTKDRDPVVRRRCLRVFENNLSYTELANKIREAIRTRLNEMVEHDIDLSVRLEARRILAKFNLDGA